MNLIKSAVIVLLSLGAISGSPVHAAEPTKDEIFRDNFIKALRDSCNKSSGSVSSSKLPGFCSCISRSYDSKFSTNQLRAISTMASRSSEARQMLQIVMNEDRLSCLSRSSD